jgi:hypothetical protein
MALYLPYGLAEFLIPFALTFAVTLGVLNIANIFEKQKQVNFLISIGLAAFAASSPWYVAILSEWGPVFAAILILVFGIHFLKKALKGTAKNDWQTLIAIAILFVVFLAFGSSLPIPSGNRISSEDILLVAGLGFVIAILIIGKNTKFNEERTPATGSGAGRTE